MSDTVIDGGTAAANDPFSPTRWTLIRQAGGGNSADAQQALNELCGIYWYPIYGYIRRRGAQHSDAQDLTQSFLAHFMKGELCSRATPAKGRFRALLMEAMKNFLNNDYRRSRRQKRGGGQAHIPIDWLAAQEKYEADAADHLTPDVYFDRALAIRLLEMVMGRLAEDHLGKQPGREGGPLEFDLLKTHLAGDQEAIPYATIAAKLGITEGNARIKVRRLRERFSALFREELSRICDPEFFEDEWQALQQALMG